MEPETAGPAQTILMRKVSSAGRDILPGNCRAALSPFRESLLEALRGINLSVVSAVSDRVRGSP